MPDEESFHPRLNPDLDAKALAKTFAERGRISIPGLLVKEDAEALYAALSETTPWSLVFNEGDKHHDIPAPQVQNLSREQIGQIRNLVLMQAAGGGFQYMYNNYPLYDHYIAGHRGQNRLVGLAEFLNGETFLDFVRTVTGFDDVTFADAQATAYAGGHFLTEHNDHVQGKNRKAAYVLNMTRHWNRNWGGYLQFFGDDGRIEEGFPPRFNTLNIFAVPKPHSVQYVAPFAQAVRYAITGWLRTGTPQHEKAAG